MLSNFIYLKVVVDQSKRLLSLLDRNPLSQTYGCFDRNYWHYKNTDFACARSQESVLTLTLLYKINNDYNIYYNNKNILDWINAGLNYWTKIQEKNGAFNEWYPKENSFVATAFSLYAISETLLQLEKKIYNYEKIISSIKKAGNWLLNKNEERAQNQEAGAALSLYNVYLLTNEDKFKISSEDKINFLFNNQKDEGWFNEYGGADIGYLSLSIDYLAKYYQKTRSEKFLPVLKKAIDFIYYFVLPDCSSGGEYGSRNTEYLIPSGFEILSQQIPITNVISSHIKKSLEKKSAIFPFSIDERYLSYVLYTYLQAYINSFSNVDIVNIKPKYEQTFSKIFSHAGIWIYSDKNIYVIVNYKKGGSLRIYFKENKNIICDSGIIIKTINGKKFTSGFLSTQNKIKINGKTLEIEGNLIELKDNILTPSINVLLRLYGLTVGRSEKLGFVLKEKLRDMLIEKSRKYYVRERVKNFFRRVSLDNEIIEITDGIYNIDRINKLIIGSKISHIYVPSSGYFNIFELNYSPISFNKHDLITCGRKISITRKYDKLGKLIKKYIN